MSENADYRRGRDHLKSVRVFDLRLKRLISKKRALEQSLYPGAIRYDLEKVQSSKEDKYPEIIAEINRLENLIETVIKARFKKIQEISKDIDSLYDEDEKTVLTYYFVEHKSVTEISSDLGYSDQGIYGIMRRGCININKELERKC